MPSQCLICQTLDFKRFGKAYPYSTIRTTVLTPYITPTKLLHSWMENTIIQHTFLKFGQSQTNRRFSLKTPEPQIKH